jgi:hypothetical protein
MSSDDKPAQKLLALLLLNSRSNVYREQREKEVWVYSKPKVFEHRI